MKCHFIVAVLAILIGGYSLTTTNFDISAITGDSICSAFCMYRIGNNYELVARCSATSTTNGVNDYCLQCDPLLFRAVTGTSGTFKCQTHKYNNEELYNTFLPLAANNKLGYSTPYQANIAANRDSNWRATYSEVFSGLPAHYGIRIRFSIYLHEYNNQYYQYPLSYSIDDTTFNYVQALDKYYNKYDIITSQKVYHTSQTLTLTFVNQKKGSGYNNNVHTSCIPFRGLTNYYCPCPRTTTHSCTPYTICTLVTTTSCSSVDYTQNIVDFSCCQPRYIQISQILIFISKCNTGCLYCNSLTDCTICNYTDGYYLNPEDNTCYLVCPQATYKNDTIPILNNAVYALQGICSTCYRMCIECTNLTICTKCYPYGRNQSFLLYGTCYNLCQNNATCTDPCPFGYVGNYTNHSCQCPLDYHYEIVASQLCLPCATQCIRCTGPTNLVCTKCSKGYYLANGTTYCTNECPSGEYKLQHFNQCFKCQTSCFKCQLEAAKCTSCQFPGVKKYLLQNQCLYWCPNGYSWNNITSKCDLCNLFQYSYLGACIKFCPSMYIAHQSNRSCIHLSQTTYTFNVLLKSIEILSHGRLIKFTILFQDGLNSSSYNAIIKKGYYIAKISYKDSKLNNFNKVRNLFQQNLVIRNLNYSNNYLFLYTQVPQNLNYRKSFYITFIQSLAGTQNITYANVTNTIYVNQYPELLKQYYKYSVKNHYDLFILPLVVIIFLFVFLQINGMYDLYIEFYRILQMLGLIVYSAFPLGQYVYYFLIGCSYANLDFIPNLYAAYVSSQKYNNFTSFFMVSDDMNFIRLTGSILLFGFFWIIILLICNYLLQLKDSRLRFMISLGYDLMQVKILHSFWSSLLFLVINYANISFSIFITFCLASFFLLAIVGRRVMIYRQNKELSPFFFWRLIGTLAICFISFANELVIGLIFIISIVIAIWQFYLLHSQAYLINIQLLTNENYMQERTFKVLNNHDTQISFNAAIPIRNMLILLFPIITSILISICIFLKDIEKQSIYFCLTLISILFIFVVCCSIFIYKFVVARKQYLVEDTLRYLKQKFANINNLSSESTINNEQVRKRPKISSHTQNNLVDQKQLQN